MQLLSPGDEDLAQLYHQVLASLAEESPSGKQSAHPAMPDRELEFFYSQYHDGEGPQPQRDYSLGRGRSPTVGLSVAMLTWADLTLRKLPTTAFLLLHDHRRRQRALRL